MKRWAVAALILLALVVGVAAAQESEAMMGDERFPAPDFPTGVAWLNVPAPLTLADLRGKVVVLDFWTYGCINCIHMIPTLHQLEEKYGDALAVIGVHSAKFVNEGALESLRQIVGRYGLTHPVINDSAFTVWNTFAPYGVNAWPTFVVIDPHGNLFAVQAGEIPFDLFDRVIGGLIATFDGLGEMDRTPLPRQLVTEGQPASPLYYPGKVLADAAGGRLFVADSSHNRIVIADLHRYTVLDVVGSGAAGLVNGDFATATFDQPQGLALSADGQTLIVADTKNHAVRALDLRGRQVTTLAGTGQQGQRGDGATSPALDTDLSSPWDVTYGADGVLYIAMAGVHQLWQLTPDGQIGALVGSGGEGLTEGAFSRATLAQPSGLYYRDGQLYFADSESSSIRVADLNTQQTALIAGPLTQSLFDFGDLDGGLGTARLQHPLSVVGDERGLLYVADTYNSKIKLLNPTTKEVVTLFGAGSPGGYADGDRAAARFDEPGGLSYAEGLVYVADTNNHAIRVIDLATEHVRTVTFPNPEVLQIGGALTVVGGQRGAVLTLSEQVVPAGAGQAALSITLPSGYKLNPNIDLIVEWASDSAAVSIAPEQATQTARAPHGALVVPVTFSAGAANLTAQVTIYYCEAVNESLCFIDQAQLVLPVRVAAAAASPTVTLERVITPPA